MQLADLRSLALTNYGHFTTMRVERGHVRGLDLHLARLSDDCQRLFGTALDVERVRQLCRLEVEGIDVAAVRVTVFDPGLDIGHPVAQANPQVLVTARPAAPLPSPPMRVQPLRYIRDVPEVKHVGLFGTVHARRQAQLDGFDDVLFVGPDGRISEGATWNIGFIRDGRIIWPDADCLPGVTLRLLQDVYESSLALVSLADVPAMDVAFATNANVGVRVISAIGATTYRQDHPLVLELRNAYQALALDRL